MKTKDFQEATALRIFKLFKDKGKSRVLLSDEVGLGKTIVASRVVELVKNWHKRENDDFFKVAYICSNVAISKQNMNKFGIKREDQMDIRNSRLSMTHLEISKRQKRQRDQIQECMPELIIPLTPATSFGSIFSEGTKEERALMFIHLSRLERLAQISDNLSVYMSNGVKNWTSLVREYEEKCKECEEDYFQRMANKLKEYLTDEDFQAIIEETNDYKSKRTVSVKLIYRLRQAFAQISLAMLQPDLVIMDEFQRFSSLLSNKEAESEQTYLFRMLLNSRSILNGKEYDPKILLLSATPYKPYSTLEELNIECVDTSYSEFMNVIQFLNEKEDDFNQFKDIWTSFNKALACAKSTNIQDIVEKKQIAETALYNIMCRTERFNSGIINDNGVKEIPIDQSDILSYAQMQRIIDDAVRNSNLSIRNVPIEYVKSSPYLLSFMESYTLKNELTKAILKHPEIVNRSQYSLLPTSTIDGFGDVKPNNAKLRMMHDMLFKEQKSQLLLWVPASNPYYRTPGVFTDCSDFSKVLVFSSWEMVPRMLSVMLSYYSEQANVKSLCKKIKQKTFSYKRGKTFGTKRLDKIHILEYPCSTLAQLYKPKDYFGQDIKDIKEDIKKKIIDLLDSLHIVYSSNIKKYSAEQITDLMKVLDGEELDMKELSESVIDVMVDAAIASPAICLYRILGDKDKALKAAGRLVSIFEKSEAAILIDSLYSNSEEHYYESILDYCVKGNLQAVLDEYDFTLQNASLDEAFKTSVLDGSSLHVEDVHSITDPNKEKYQMRCGYAIPYISKAVTEKTEERIINKQDAFNSPFRPFVLSTTSIGQEGLDFHPYSRKIVHWNLPSNPVDLEQREGRINRYACLAVRRNAAKLFGNETDWNTIFDNIGRTLKVNYSDIVPFWCLPINSLNNEQKQKLEYIERIVPLYPLSRDSAKYQRLINVLSLYRMTLGQPRQEELLKLLSGLKLDDEEIRKFTLNLCPFDKQRNN